MIIRLLICCMFFISGCASLSQNENIELKGEVAQLQTKYNQLQSRHADLYSKSESYLVSVDTMNASLQELYKKVSLLTQKVDDLEVVVQKYSQNGENSAVSAPSEIYKNAYSDFSVGKYDLAIAGFKSFLSRYENHELSAQSQYYIAECLYAQQKWQDAFEEYKKIEIQYPESEFISSSRLKKALCLEALGKKQEALIVFKSIASDYPKSAEAFTSKEKIKAYANVNKK